MNIGQINRGSSLGEQIYNIILKNDVKNIVEIGTWNGLGTTKCIYDGIIDSNKKTFNVYSLESNLDFYNQAINNLPKLNNFNIILGRIIEIEDLIDFKTYNTNFFNNHSLEEHNLWCEQDISNYKNIPNVIDILPKKIDLLILDGGEFSSHSEFLKLKDRSKYIILDDINTIKNYEVCKYILNNPEYEVISYEPNDRNGYLICKKINNK